MALPRYQRAGVRISQMPQVTTVGLQQAARTTQTLTQSLDRLASFAFRQAEVEAQVKGAEYGALNAPSQQQLSDAIAAGEDVSEIVPGDTSTVFGRAARTTALDAITTQFEAEARKTIVGLQTEFENENISLDEMGATMQDLVASQTDIMRRISPQAATKFSASVGIVTNSAYLAASKEQAKRDKADYEIQLRSDIDVIIRNAETVVKGGATVEDDGQLQEIEPKLDALRQQIANEAMLLNDPTLYQTKINEFNQRVSEAKINVVLEDAMTTPGKALQVASGVGVFDDAQVQNVYESMSPPERLSLFEQLQSALSNKFTLEGKQEAAREKDRKDLVVAKRIELFEARTRGTEEDVERILSDIREIDESEYLSLETAIYTEGGIDNAEVVADLDNLVLNNDLTYKDIDAARSNGQISSSTYTSFKDKLDALRDERFNSAMETVKLELGHPPKGIYNLSDPDREAVRKINRIELELRRAKQNNPDMDMDAFVEQKIKDVQSQGPTETQIKQSQGRIDALRGQLNLPSDASTAEVKAALNKAVGAGKFNAQGAAAYDGDFTVLENQ